MFQKHFHCSLTFHTQRGVTRVSTITKHPFWRDTIIVDYWRSREMKTIIWCLCLHSVLHSIWQRTEMGLLKKINPRTKTRHYKQGVRSAHVLFMWTEATKRQQQVSAGCCQIFFYSVFSVDMENTEEVESRRANRLFLLHNSTCGRSSPAPQISFQHFNINFTFLVLKWPKPETHFCFSAAGLTAVKSAKLTHQAKSVLYT